MAADGTITIDTRIEQKSFNQGLRKIQISAAGALNKILLPLVKIGDKVQGVLSVVMSSLKSGLAGLVTGLFVAFALSVVKIFAFIREAVQDAIVLDPKLNKQVEEIQNSFVELKNAIGAAFLPILQAAIPYIKMALAWLIELFNRAAMITAALMGQKQALQIIQGSAQKIADANKKTEKAVRGQLAAFDQINVLQQPQEEDTSDLPKVAGELVPVTDDILDQVQKIKDIIASWFDDPIDKLKETWGKIVEWFRANVLDPIAEWWNSTWLGQLLGKLWENFTTTWARIFENTVGVFNAIKENAALYFKGVIEYLTGIFTGDWALAWQGIKDMAAGAWNALWAIIQGGLENWFLLISGFANHVKMVFEAVFGPVIGNALKWVQDKFIAVFGGIRDFVMGVINKIIGFIQSMIASIMEGIAAVSGLLGVTNTGIGGASASANLRPPGLATGAVIPPNARFAAILGDQKSGRNLEAPENLIRQIMREEMQGMGGEMTVNMPVYLDGELVYRNQKKVSSRHGKSLIAGNR